MRRNSLLALLPLLMSIALPAAAQVIPAPSSRADLNVIVTFEDNHSVPALYEVKLMTGDHFVLAQALTDSYGQAKFHRVGSDPYYLSVAGPDAVTTEISFSIYRGELNHTEYVRLPRKQSAQAGSTAATVSRASLEIPDKAKKEFDKGLEAFKKDDFSSATQRFNKAIGIYPQYCLAYVNLGLIAMKDKKVDEGEHDFQQAIAADPQDPAAYIHLARSQVLRKQYATAEPLLQKATSISPLDPDALSLLAATEFYLGKTEEAVATARKVHSVPHDHFAISHLVAAQALIKQNQPALAADELRLFLKEAPNDPQATNAQATLQSIENGKRP